MYKVKRRGPRTDPYGSPQVMGIKLDLTLLIDQQLKSNVLPGLPDGKS